MKRSICIQSEKKQYKKYELNRNNNNNKKQQNCPRELPFGFQQIRLLLVTSIHCISFISLSLPNQMECPILVIEVFSIYHYLLGLPALGINNENSIEENNFPLK